MARAGSVFSLISASRFGKYIFKSHGVHVCGRAFVERDEMHAISRTLLRCKVSKYDVWFNDRMHSAQNLYEYAGRRQLDIGWGTGSQTNLYIFSVDGCMLWPFYPYTTTYIYLVGGM